jgi:allantoate deiminase
VPKPLKPDLSLGRALMQRLDELAAVTDEPGVLTRLYLSPSHRAAATLVGDWMRTAGMSVRMDALATVIGRYEGARPGAPALLIGSHIDTVRDAGKYDGNLGVLSGIAAIEALSRKQERLPFAIEVLAFGDEEGVRFPATLSSSRAIAGTIDPAVLAGKDRDGIAMADALRDFGCDPGAWSSAKMSASEVIGYLELHIEQGPVLEAEDLPLGIVTAIAGATRMAVTVEGMAGHAGTVPMGLRRDALAAAAEMVLAIEAIAHAEPDLVATVGQIEAKPGAVNVVPGAARFTIDVRSPKDEIRKAAEHEIEKRLGAIARRRNVAVALGRTHDAPATPCNAKLIQALEAALEEARITPRKLVSGAGHDAMAVAALCPVAMMFVRCKGGISHNPAESISVKDADAAVRVLLNTIRQLGRDF